MQINDTECRDQCLGVPDRAGFVALLQAAGHKVNVDDVNVLIARQAGYYLQAIRTCDLLFLLEDNFTDA